MDAITNKGVRPDNTISRDGDVSAAHDKLNQKMDEDDSTVSCGVTGVEASGGSVRLERTISLLGAIGIVMGSMIGRHSD